ncbi:TraR/DksA C4-type zinc finger protein [Herbiconiux daphne]|uniref:TraR/DksA C4-type zinc finger protein n=1 Tax=Herbiconiux daphne TaxID=2970914 RepID=UPI0038B23DAC
MPHNDRHQSKTDAIVDFGVNAVRSQIGKGKSREYCLDCGSRIPDKRREAVKGCLYCVKCQAEHDTVITIPYGKR